MLLDETPIPSIYGTRGYVDLREVCTLSEKENGSFRLYRIREVTGGLSHALEVQDDHCEYVESLIQPSPEAEYWKLQIVKARRKRRRTA
jgi:hypothetical protein